MKDKYDIAIEEAYKKIGRDPTAHWNWDFKYDLIIDDLMKTPTSEMRTVLLNHVRELVNSYFNLKQGQE